MKLNGIVFLIFVLSAGITMMSCSVNAGGSSLTVSNGSGSSAGTAANSAAGAVSVTAAIVNAPDIQVSLPESLKLKLKLKAPSRYRAPYDVTTFTDFAALPGVKSQSWYRLVQDQQNQSPTVSMVQAIKYLASTTNIMLSNAMVLGDLSNFMGQMTLHSNTLYVESPSSNVFNIWWKAVAAVSMGGGPSGPGPLTPIAINAYFELNMADTNHAQVQMFGAILTNGSAMGYIRGYYDGSNSTVFDMDCGMNGPVGINFKESYITNSGQTYMISKSIQPQQYMDTNMQMVSYISTNISVAYGDATMGGIVNIGSWGGNGNYNLNREVYNSAGDLIYTGWGDTSVPSWAFGWATNNGYNLLSLTNRAPQRFYIARIGYNTGTSGYTNISYPYVGTFYTAWTVTNGTYYYDYSSATNINFTNNGQAGWFNSYSTTNILSYSFDAVNWTPVTDPALLSNFQNIWGVYYVNAASLGTGDATYMWSASGSGNGWTNFVTTNLGAPYEITNVYTNWAYNYSTYVYEMALATNIQPAQPISMTYTNIWSNVQAFEIGFQIPAPETNLGIAFYVQNSFPLKYLELDPSLAGYSVRRMEQQSYTNIWNSSFGTNTYVETNIYVNYEWWLSDPMWSNQNVFTNWQVMIYSNFTPAYNTDSVYTYSGGYTNYYTNLGVPIYPFLVVTNISYNWQISSNISTSFDSNWWTNLWTNLDGNYISTNIYTSWTTNPVYVFSNVITNSWENGQNLREGNTNNLRLNNLQDFTTYYQDADGSMVQQTAKFAYSTSPKPQYFSVIPSASNLIATVAGNMQSFTANNGMFDRLDLEDAWTNARQGNFPGKWAAISGKFDQLTN